VDMESDMGTATAPRGVSPMARAAILFVNFFFIILAYYHVKPASRSLFIENLGADDLPYVWIGTALFLGAIIGLYHRIVERHSRVNVVLGSCIVFIAILIGFYFLLQTGSTAASVAFYIFTDIFSVVLVEQFWSLTNTVFVTEEGKRWYGLIATGGLVGGVAGGVAATFLLDHTPLHTRELLLVAAGILGLVFLLNLAMDRLHLFREAPYSATPIVASGSWRVLFENRYLLLITLTLLLAQLAQPLVEFQFIKTIESHLTELDARTAYLASFFAVMGLVSIGINLFLTPLIHRYLGVIAGLLAQPLLLGISSLVFYASGTLNTAAIMKISDRGLSYSINRASKELLYVPIDPIRTYQIKAWIDMFGYRVFKVFGSLLILILTQWLDLGIGVAQISWLTITGCGIWLLVIYALSKEYHRIAALPLRA
jgi:AAA family ATP:ADP antiporter